MTLGMSDIIKKARSELSELTGLEISSTLSAEKDAEEWRVTMEVVEKRSIPDGMDILAIYDTRMDTEGNMMEFRRVRMRKRIDTEETE
ncbi:MAG: gas vesicle protein GvpO [Desulfatiglandaceae bacterium]|nr:gas vesicle protein [Deltaproteobacteria bacterium]